MRRPDLQLPALVGGLLGRGGSQFTTAAPSPQTALDSVRVPWASRFPITGIQSGDANLFDDERVRWAIEELGGVGGATCVELGPLEGGHSYMLQQAGAASVTAVEANKDAFLKCLVTKELLGLERCSFLCGDVLEYLSSTPDRFDVCWCVGILYHMVEPVQLLDLISKRADRLYIWTHYYDAVKLSGRRGKGARFANAQVIQATHSGFDYTLHRQEYGWTERLGGFLGGTRPYSHWLTLPDLLGALEHFGWHDIRTRIAEDTPHGPAVDLVATRA